MITADHGHLLDEGELVRRDGPSRDGGESAARWRLPASAKGAGGELGAGELGAGEVLVRGRRVLAEGGAVVVPWSERLRYGRRQAGYHGGASPQELLLPLALFVADDRAPAGFAEVAFAGAAFAGAAFTGAAFTGAAGSGAAGATSMEVPVGSPEAASAATAAAADGLWARLRQSEVYRQSREGLGLAPETESRIGALLEELARQGGQLRLEQLERRLQVGRPRLRALLSQAQRLLHLDGFVVLELDEASGFLRLDRQVLERQFGCGGSPQAGREGNS